MITHNPKSFRLDRSIEFDRSTTLSLIFLSILYLSFTQICHPQEPLASTHSAPGAQRLYLSYFPIVYDSEDNPYDFAWFRRPPNHVIPSSLPTLSSHEVIFTPFLCISSNNLGSFSFSIS